jgi:hypothetical protein
VVLPNGRTKNMMGAKSISTCKHRWYIWARRVIG